MLRMSDFMTQILTLFFFAFLRSELQYGSALLHFNTRIYRTLKFPLRFLKYFSCKETVTILKHVTHMINYRENFACHSWPAQVFS